MYTFSRIPHFSLFSFSLPWTFFSLNRSVLRISVYRHVECFCVLPAAARTYARTCVPGFARSWFRLLGGSQGPISPWDYPQLMSWINISLSPSSNEGTECGAAHPRWSSARMNQ
ncbi:hypothetical protein AG1IA_04794 [Rhizoctonia solani AG-1 IA]|uniref:Uncharacterized protein n=1 Tax=Thanatephorus cucumeris (strain AG1-IA) TaxID=983506 RepID=L8WT72_THACA|nr:hypothetical protein AG1IA_04794 [Rhizoctonia solani AG-1 IA]